MFTGSHTEFSLTIEDYPHTRQKKQCASGVTVSLHIRWVIQSFFFNQTDYPEEKTLAGEGLTMESGRG